eukprot:s678_g20.t1
MGKGKGMLRCDYCKTDLCEVCNDEDSEEEILTCSQCRSSLCALCSEKGMGKDTGTLCCDHCETVLCMSCRQLGEGKGKGDTISVCGKCGDACCDLCLQKGKGKGIVRCGHCSKALCMSCNEKLEESGEEILACRLCDWAVCDCCLKKGIGKGISRCDHCSAEICQSCNKECKGEGNGILACSRCNRKSCELCLQNGKIKPILRCQDCSKEVCLDCNNMFENTVEEIVTCSRCDSTSCHFCLKKGKGKGMLCCNGCTEVLCQSCNKEHMGGAKGMLVCDRCDRKSCHRCVVEQNGMTLCKYCKGCDILADYHERGAQLDACKAEISVLQSKVDELSARLADARQQAHRGKIEAVSQVLPSCDGLAYFVSVTLPRLTAGTATTVPIQALRWTHHGINAQLAFGENHENSQESIFKLFEQLFRQRLTPLELTEEDPLLVFLHRGPDHHLGLYSACNRRLLAVLMYQATRRDELVKVHVLVCSPDDPRMKSKWEKCYDGVAGLSIQPHEGRRASACHRGLPLFKGNVAVVTDALERARNRPHSQRVQDSLNLLYCRLRERPSARDMDDGSVTFVNTKVESRKRGREDDER